MKITRIEHEESYCHNCQTSRKWTIEWWALKPGSTYYPKDDSDGSKFIINVCPGCIRGMFRDVARDTRYMHWNDCKNYEDQFWCDEVTMCVKRAKERRRQFDDVSEPYLPAHLIAVPDDGDDKMEP